MKTLVLYNNPFVESYLFDSFFQFSDPVIEATNHTPYKYQWEYQLPDFSKKDLKIQTENNVLTITGDKKGSSFFNSQRRNQTSFSTHITLSDDMDVEKINAKFKKGILTIEIPKKKESVSYREIPISGLTAKETKHEKADNKTGWFDVLTTKIKRTLNHTAQAVN